MRVLMHKYMHVRPAGVMRVRPAGVMHVRPAGVKFSHSEHHLTFKTAKGSSSAALAGLGFTD